MRNSDINPYASLVNAGSGVGEVIPDALTMLASTQLPKVSTIYRLAGTGGDLIGLLSDIPEDVDIDGLREYSVASVVPGVAAYRKALRDRLADRLTLTTTGNADKVGNVRLSESAGGILTRLLGSVVGGAVGFAKGGVAGGLLGAGAGYGTTLVGSGLARLLGMLKKRRTSAEHADYLLSEPYMSNALIPFVGSYNAGRRDRLYASAILNSRNK